MKKIPQNEWKWFGNAGHLCVSNHCRFHLTTKVGNHLVSTVGEYYPPGGQGPQEVGSGRTFETMVFAVCGTCECGCGLPLHSGHEVYRDGYNNAKDATAGHHAACNHFSSLR